MDDLSSRIVSLEDAVRWRNDLRAEGKRVAVTNGCFDLMHRGHAEYLTTARAQADALLVLINSDASVRALKGPARPIVGESDRAALLAALRAVDRVVIFDGVRCDRELAALRPDIYVKAGDYTLETLAAPEREVLLAAKSEIIFVPFVSGLSTSNLVAAIRGGRG